MICKGRKYTVIHSTLKPEKEGSISFISSLVFVPGYRDKQEVSTFMKVKHHIDATTARRILHCTNSTMV
jgi:hypothetical protein